MMWLFGPLFILLVNHGNMGTGLQRRVAYEFGEFNALLRLLC